MPSLINIFKTRGDVINKAAGLSGNIFAKNKKKKLKTLEQRHPERFKEFLLDESSDEMSFKEFLARK